MGKVGAIVAQVISWPLLTKGAPPSCSGRSCTPWLDRLMQIFALFMLCGTFSSLLIPETKGYTLEELAGEPPTSYNSGRNGSIIERSKARWWNPFSGGQPAGFFYPRIAPSGRTGIMTTPEAVVQNVQPKRGWRFWKRNRGPNNNNTVDCAASSSSTAGFATSGETVVANAGVLPGWGVGWGRIDRGGNTLAMDNIRLQDLVVKPTPIYHTMRSLEDVLMDNPEKEFKGISHHTLNLVAKSALHVTDEVMVKWLHKWCPCMDFALIFDWIRSTDYVENDYKHNLYMVPPEAMDIKGTGTTLANLFRKCRGVYSKYNVLQVPNVVEVFDHCIILCRVLKNEKCASLLHKTKEFVQWLPLGLSCKELEVKKNLSRKLDQIPTSCRDRDVWEKELLDSALLEFEIHRQEFTVQLMQQVKVLLDSSNPFHPDNKS
ncbi:hypothetical protein PC116_g28367 [Phytophthora cactorum]|nr:hypothetical protein PC116_g28367 [Phytophthora cactorum]